MTNELRKVLVIAEAGVNHNGSLSEALRLVEAAADIGADIVKFQAFNPSELASTNAPLASYQRVPNRDGDSQRSLLEGLMFSTPEWMSIRDHCRISGIEFLSTAFDRHTLDSMIDLGIRRIKVPSGELTNRRLLEFVGTKNLPVLLSTGMADIAEVKDALNILLDQGLPKNLVTVLHCTSAYPAPFDDLNLLAIKTMRETLGLEIGYSDHSAGPEAVIAAVALGASVVEKHLTLDRLAPGPDHAASMEPGHFSEMVQMVRHIERAFGDGEKRCMASELELQMVARRSLAATCAIAKGTLITEQMVTAIRPGGGLSPMTIDKVLNQPAWRDFSEGEMLS